MQDHRATLVQQTLADQTIRPTPASLGVPPPTHTRSSAGGRTQGLLDHASSLEGKIDLEGILGEGGMGLVRLGRQRSLEREVAVKSVNPQANPESARRSLLQEAYATARLEHPNVIPIHALAMDASGSPHVVMRRVQGQTWRYYLASSQAIAQDFGARDALAWHLGVVMSVCNAVHYAHRRGIIHRDLKPDNIMIGRFGEVWVLDWGLALRFTEDDAPRLPLARDERRIVGTPRFMAPEMALGRGQDLGPATDVYLLGGLLYVMLTGRGPHPGTEIQQTLASIPHFRADLGPDSPLALSPPRLAAIAARALSAEPAARQPSAEAVRLELLGFLEERGADQLARQASTQLQALEHDLEIEEPDRQQVYRHFGASRFGFEHALSVWPQHDAADAGLTASLVAMASYELDQEDPRAASVHLAELEAPPPALVARRDALVHAQDQARTRAARLLADQDPMVGRPTRIFVFGLVLLAWTLIPLVWWLMDRPLTVDLQLRVHGGMLVVVAGLVVWARRSMSRTALNRRVAQLLVVVSATLVLADLGAGMMDLTALAGATIHTLIYAGMAALVADVIGPIALVPAVAYGLTFFLCARWPELVMPLTAACNGLVVVIAASLWGSGYVPPHGPRQGLSGQGLSGQGLSGQGLSGQGLSGQGHSPEGEA